MVSIKRPYKDLNANNMRLYNSPRLLHLAGVTHAHVVGDVAVRAVDLRVVWFAHVQKVRPHAPHRHLGDVCERLADRTAEDEHAHLPVQGRDVRVSHEWALLQVMDPIALANDNLQAREKHLKRCLLTLKDTCTIALFIMYISILRIHNGQVLDMRRGC